MRRFSLLTVALVLPALGLLLASSGCGKKTTTGDAGAPTTTGGPNGGKDKGVALFKPATAKDVEMKYDSLDGVVKGKVIYDGTPPEPAIEARITEAEFKAVCHDQASEDEKIVQTWIVNKSNKGVANVLVVLQPPAGQFFPFDKAKISFEKDVKIDQPHCAFVPHVSVVFPVYWDGEKKAHMKTGQTFAVWNSSSVTHNTKMTGDAISEQNPTLPPKGKPYPVDFEKASRSPVTLQCSIHGWMSGYVWVLDHPYAAVTDKDGNFEIKGVPTGVDLTVAAWHEEKAEDGRRRAFSTQAVKLTKAAPTKEVEIKVTK